MTCYVMQLELIDDFCYTLIVIRTLGHILRQILVAKIPISHRGESNPRTSDLESDTLAPYQQALMTNFFLYNNNCLFKHVISILLWIGVIIFILCHRKHAVRIQKKVKKIFVIQ